jgi:signal recognition particle receptor subunit beta
MAVLNATKQELQCKIVYYGPGRGGKTTNLEFIHNKLKNKTKSKMLSIKTHGDRTLFFDFLPLDLGKIGGYKVRLQLYTVPGQVRYNATRKLVLRGVDGIVFVADSLSQQREKNIVSMQNLEKNLLEYGIAISKIPLVIQYNKRDLEDKGVELIPVEVMESDLNSKLKTDSFPASAIKGENVLNTLKMISKLTLKDLKDNL